MTEVDYGLLGIVIVAVQMAFELVKQWVLRIIPPRSMLTPDEQMMLSSLHVMHVEASSEQKRLTLSLISISHNIETLVKTSEQNQRDMLSVLRTMQKEARR